MISYIKINILNKAMVKYGKKSTMTTIYKYMFLKKLEYISACHILSRFVSFNDGNIEHFGLSG
jgi:hypothetical protein